MRNKQKKRKTSLSIKLIYIFFISVIVINLTMARYTTVKTEKAEARAATWKFVLTKENQNLPQSFQIDLVDTITSSSENISQGVIAPRYNRLLYIWY